MCQWPRKSQTFLDCRISLLVVVEASHGKAELGHHIDSLDHLDSGLGPRSWQLVHQEGQKEEVFVAGRGSNFQF